MLETGIVKAMFILVAALAFAILNYDKSIQAVKNLIRLSKKSKSGMHGMPRDN